MIATVAKVNAALKAAGHAERLRRGRGYFYFTGGDAAAWFTSGVYVNRVDALTVEAWLKERSRLAAEK